MKNDEGIDIKSIKEKINRMRGEILSEIRWMDEHDD